MLRTEAMPSPLSTAQAARNDSAEIRDLEHAARTRIIARAFAYSRVMPEHAMFTHVTAALLWKIPVPLRTFPAISRASNADDRALDVGVFTPYRPSRAAGIRGARLQPHLVTASEHRGLRLAHPASTWAQLGAELTVDELIVAGDAIVRIPRRAGGTRGTPADALSTIAELAAATAMGRRIGASKLREALDAIRVGSASPPESDLRVALMRAGLPEPHLDVNIFGPHNKLIGYTEIAYPQWRVLIEYEGDHHRVSRAQWNRDIEKHAQCVALGWTVIRITAAHLYPHPSRAVTRIRAALDRAGWRP